MSAVTQRGDEYFNSSLLWEEGADNPVDTYDKRHPVPFGEYVPDRWLYRNFAPDLIDLIQREYTPGTSSPMFDVDGVGVGLAICFDVIYDDVIWEGARDGAEVYMFQTNNADFRGTDENLQQLAFARMRAIETGRAVVNLSTVGTSQVIAPDGATIDGLPADEAGHMLTDVPLRTGLTPGRHARARGSRRSSAGEASSHSRCSVHSSRCAGVATRQRTRRRRPPKGPASQRMRDARQALILSTLTVFAGAAASADVGEALLEELFELGERAALEQHVPVRARDLVAAVIDGRGALADAQQRLGAAGAAFPGIGNLCVGREGQRGVTSTGRARVCVMCAFMEHDALFAL